jgi:biopolymer transport protein ExbB
MDAIYSAVKFFVTGGPFMYPILIVFAVGIAIAIERYVTLTQVRRRNDGMWRKIEPALSSGDFDQAREMTSNDDMEESMMEIIPQLEKRTSYVALGANIATLLGLLGTIMGLIQAFTAVANANPAEKADLLSASISVAMNTTAFGLISAIPLLVTHSVLTAKTSEIVDSLEMASVKALNVITAMAKRQLTA